MMTADLSPDYSDRRVYAAFPKEKAAMRDTTNATRQMRLRERRKAKGFRRISIWLSPEQISVLQYLGGEPWLGRTVKAILEETL